RTWDVPVQMTVVVPLHRTPSPVQSWRMLPLLTTSTPLGPELLATVVLVGWIPTNPPASPAAVSFTVSKTSTPALLRSARYNFCVSGSNQLISTLHLLLGLLSNATTLPWQGSTVGVVGGGGTCGMTSTPPTSAQVEVIRFPRTPKFAVSSRSESARAVAVPPMRTAAKTSAPYLRDTLPVIFMLFSFDDEFADNSAVTIKHSRRRRRVSREQHLAVS